MIVVKNFLNKMKIIPKPVKPISDIDYNIPEYRRRLDIDANVNDIAEEIGRLYGYNNLVSSLPNVKVRRGEYVGDVKYRKMVSKRLRSLGLNEVKTYTLISPKMAAMFKYEDKEFCYFSELLEKNSTFMWKFQMVRKIF